MSRWVVGWKLILLRLVRLVPNGMDAIVAAFRNLCSYKSSSRNVQMYFFSGYLKNTFIVGSKKVLCHLWVFLSATIYLLNQFLNTCKRTQYSPKAIHSLSSQKTFFIVRACIKKETEWVDAQSSCYLTTLHLEYQLDGCGTDSFVD